jgi:hypothetical protein
MLGLGSSIISGTVLSGIGSPLDLGDLNLYYDFSTTTGSNGATINTFANAGTSGSDYDLTAHSTSSKRPTIDTSTLSKRSAQFTNDRFTTDNVYVTTGETFTIFYIMKKGTISANDAWLTGTEGSPINQLKHGSHRALIIQCNGEVDSDSDNSSLTIFTDDTNGGTSNVTMDTDTHLFIWTKTADETVNVYQDTAFITTGTHPTDGDETTNFRIENLGEENDGGASLEAHIGEFGIYNKVLSAGEITQLQTFLIDKWGL